MVSKTELATYDVTVTGKQSYHGHDTVVLSAKTHTSNPNGSSNTEATVYYDPQARLVIGMHNVITNNGQVTGVTMMSTYDVNLKEAAAQ